MFCTKCGKKAAADWKHCPDCGASIANAPASEAVSVKPRVIYPKAKDLASQETVDDQYQRGKDIEEISNSTVELAQGNQLAKSTTNPLVVLLSLVMVLAVALFVVKAMQAPKNFQSEEFFPTQENTISGTNDGSSDSSSDSQPSETYSHQLGYEVGASEEFLNQLLLGAAENDKDLCNLIYTMSVDGTTSDGIDWASVDEEEFMSGCLQGHSTGVQRKEASTQTPAKSQYPTCINATIKTQLGDTREARWLRPDGQPGLCILPNSNGTEFYSFGN